MFLYLVDSPMHCHEKQLTSLPASGEALLPGGSFNKLRMGKTVTDHCLIPISPRSPPRPARISCPMMNAAWAAMCFVGLIWGLVAGRGALLTEAVLAAVMDAVQAAIRMAGGFALWSGMLAILEQSGAIRAATRAMSPLLSRLFPGVSKDSPAREYMAMNMAANMLGLGNAATPMGLAAMRSLSDDAGKSDTATDAMCMFLVINASSLQLFPSTVIAMRAAAGSVAPASVVLPTLISTAVSTLVGITVCALFARIGRARHGR